MQDAVSKENIFPPRFSSAFFNPVLGVVTKSDHSQADTIRAERFLKLAGARRIFRVSAFDGTGVEQFREFLQTEGALKE